jgi:hypothetical protein
MMRTILASLTGLLLVLGACAMPTDEAGDASGLVTMTAEELEGQLLYLDPSISTIPMTPDEARGIEGAVPVRIRFYDDLVVAWLAPGGEALECAAEAAVASWRLETAVPIDGDDDVAPGEGSGGIETPELPGIEPPRGLLDQPPFAPVSRAVIRIRSQGPYDPAGRLEWLRGRIGDLTELPGGGHPGCL